MYIPTTDQKPIMEITNKNSLLENKGEIQQLFAILITGV